MQEPEATLELALEHGLTEEEYGWICERLGRTPNFTELGVFAVMWSEHCSYKNSIALLKTLPREGGRLLVGAGEENAGLVDIGDGLAVAFKIESHNHPSAVEPYQGAATGVGGILRDIFTMGARPIAALNSLRFGSLDNPRTRFLFDGVVRGIGDYGNCFGVPTVGGEVYFDESYQGNPLVNAMAVGIVKTDKVVSAIAEGEGNSVMIVGSSTGRDGVHGATFASEEISEKSEAKRPSVQVGDPFTEKLLLEATLEIIDEDLVVGIQDMGAAGISCCTSEMSEKGGVGMNVDLDKAPLREEGMSAYEIMLSESQERMLVVAKKGKEGRIKEIFDKWDLNSEIVGDVRADGLLDVRRDGERKALIPAYDLVLGGGAPVYHRETKKPAYIDEAHAFDLSTVPEPADYAATFRKIFSSPNIVSKRWVFEQYDSMVRTNTAVGPGSDAAVVYIKGTKKALAMTTDCNSRYVYLDPREGAKIAVAEAALNVVCSGAKPLAITNCLNFGNPYKPEMYWQFKEAVEGMGEACRAFETPVTGGNVSFYNESPGVAVYPTPVIGMVGLIEDVDKTMTSHFKGDGETIYVIGENFGEIGGSEYLKIEHGLTTGAPPRLDLDREKRLHAALLDLVDRGLVRSAHDVVEGGLAIAVAECCVSNPVRYVGANIQAPAADRLDLALFGESRSRVVVSATQEQQPELEERLRAAGVPFKMIGLTGGDALTLEDRWTFPIEELADVYYRTIERAMEADVQAY
jgi:phosphoribosylformylglycinamidine synthase subunit PurL